MDTVVTATDQFGFWKNNEDLYLKLILFGYLFGPTIFCESFCVFPVTPLSPSKEDVHIFLEVSPLLNG